MKPNEAPEKIYRTTTYLDNDKGKTEWKREQVSGAENIEYVRTDAFIEKACKFIRERTGIPQRVEFYEGEPLALSYIDYAQKRLEAADKMIEDFKKYMKGE